MANQEQDLPELLGLTLDGLTRSSEPVGDLRLTDGAFLMESNDGRRRLTESETLESMSSKQVQTKDQLNEPKVKPHKLDITNDYIGIPGQFYIRIASFAGCLTYREHTFLFDNRGHHFEVEGEVQPMVQEYIPEGHIPGPLGSVWSMKWVRSVEKLTRKKFVVIKVHTSVRTWQLRFKAHGAAFKKSVTYRTKRVKRPIGDKMASGRRLDVMVTTDDDTDLDDPAVSVF